MSDTQLARICPSCQWQALNCHHIDVEQIVLRPTSWCDTHDSPKRPKELCQKANATFYRLKWLGEPDHDFGCVESSRLVEEASE